MTRFARAKGSKASNERVPNDPTPWHVMKQQLDDNRLSRNAQPEKTKTAKQLLKEKDEPFYCDTTGNVNNDWAEFERPQTDKSKKHAARGKVESNAKPLSKKNKKKVENGDLENGNEGVRDSTVDEIETSQKFKSKKRKSSISVAESTPVVDNAVRTEMGSNEDRGDAIDSKKKLKKRKSDASYMESAECPGQATVVGDDTPTRNNKKQKTSVLDGESAEDAGDSKVNVSEPDPANAAKSKSKKRKSDTTEPPEANSASKVVEVDSAGSEPRKKKNRRKNKKVSSSEGDNLKVDESATDKDDEKDEKIEVSNSTSLKMSKRQKRNQKRKNKIASDKSTANGVSVEDETKEPNSGAFDVAGNEWSSNVNFGKKSAKKSDDTSNDDSNREKKVFKKPSNGANGSENVGAKRKAAKIRDDKEHKRRKPDVPSIKCNINGTDVEIVKYDGFPVKKEDADRLKDLRKQMILKGIPKSEINAAMKLERRKAEKSLARMRKQVCFHCRKAGHNLSECPELGEGESATGICFKCGSTEHTHFECKVTKKQEYGFASCFICREQGHIAKQCPDNPKGLYPQGGSCKICGDVTHLRKDCPEATKDKEENAMTLGTIVDDGPESLDDGNDETKVTTKNVNKGKIVKF